MTANNTKDLRIFVSYADHDLRTQDANRLNELSKKTGYSKWKLMNEALNLLEDKLTARSA